MLPDYFYEFLESSHSGASLVSPPTSPPTVHGFLLSQSYQEYGWNLDFFVIPHDLPAVWIHVLFLSVAILLIPLLACIFPSVPSSPSRWTWLPLAVRFLGPQTEMHADEDVASRNPFSPSLCLVQHCSCFVYCLGRNRTQTASISPRLPYNQVNRIPSWYFQGLGRPARGLLIPA